jgi:carotenoid cleavage dioxygenase
MTSAAIENPYLTGNFAPVTEEVDAYDLPVTGTLPPELNGRYLRIGPNPVGEFDAATYHWFIGTGMVHGVRLRAGHAEWYRNRFVRGDEPESSPNTSVLAHAGRLLALVEAGQPPVTMSPDLGAMTTCDGPMAAGFTAHPKIDPVSGELHAVAYQGWSPTLRYLVLDPDGHAVHETAIPVDDGPMVHDMALTETRVVLLDLPVTLAPELLDRMAGASAFSLDRFPMRWNENHPSRVGILPRLGEADQVCWIEVPRCYVFHVLNAYDEPGGAVTMDVVRYDHVFRDEVRGPAGSMPRLARWTVDPARGTVSEQAVADLGLEFPRVAPHVLGRPHRYGYFAGVDADGLIFSGDVERDRLHGPESGPLVKIDLRSGETTRHRYGEGRVTGEPAFVPRSGASAEDDGWLLSVVHDETVDRSELVVLDAADLTTVARVHLPRRVPYGFHGNWIADDELHAQAGS